MQVEKTQGEEFNPKDIVIESLAWLVLNLRLYAVWGVISLVSWIISLMYSMYDDGQVGRDVGNNLLLFAISMLVIWGSIVFSIRLYRHVILGVVPVRGFVAELFAGRTWRYIGNGMLINMKAGLVSVFLGILPLSLVYSAVMKSGITGLEALDKVLFVLGIQLSLFVGFVVVAAEIVLLFPEVAVDGPACFSRLDRLAGHSRWRIVKTITAIWALPWLVTDSLLVAAAFGVGLDGIPGVIASGISYALDAAAYVLSTLAAAMIYKKMSPSWAEMDAEYIRIVRENRKKDDGAYRL